MRRVLQLLVLIAVSLVAVNAQCIVTCDPAPKTVKSHCHPKPAAAQCSHDLSIVEKVPATDFALVFVMPVAAMRVHRNIAVDTYRVVTANPTPPPIVHPSISILRL